MKISDLIKSQINEEADYNNSKPQQFKQTQKDLKTTAPTDLDQDAPTKASKDDVTTATVPDQIHKEKLATESINPANIALATGFAVFKVKNNK